METSDLRFYVLNLNQEIKEEFKKQVNTVQGHTHTHTHTRARARVCVCVCARVRVRVSCKLYWPINPYFTF